MCSCQHGLARAVWESSSLLQFIVMVVNENICICVPAVFLLMNSVIIIFYLRHSFGIIMFLKRSFLLY